MRFENAFQRELYYIGQLDFCYFALKEMSADSVEKLSPIESMVDSATGMDRHLIEQKVSSSIELVKCIIKCKTKLSYDISEDKNLLVKLRKINRDANRSQK